MTVHPYIEWYFEKLNKNIKLKSYYIQNQDKDSYPVGKNTFREMGETFTFILSILIPECLQIHW